MKSCNNQRNADLTDGELLSNTIIQLKSRNLVINQNKSNFRNEGKNQQLFLEYPPKL